jgi:hypothetical protein
MSKVPAMSPCSAAGESGAGSVVVAALTIGGSRPRVAACPDAHAPPTSAMPAASATICVRRRGWDSGVERATRSPKMAWNVREDVI